MKERLLAPEQSLGSLENTLEIQFKDPELLRLALTHRSFAFEQGGLPHNERLEFLGDAVLGFVVTDLIYCNYPDLPEGRLAKLRAGAVNMAALAEIARDIGLGEQLLLGKGEEQSGGREKASILADGFEALLGAIYLDQGISRTRRVITRLIHGQIKDQVELGIESDFKTNLQEVAAAFNGGDVPEYRVTSSGPDHAKKFQAEVYLAGELVGYGDGKSKKEAEQAAARRALAVLSR